MLDARIPKFDIMENAISADLLPRVTFKSLFFDKDFFYFLLKMLILPLMCENRDSLNITLFAWSWLFYAFICIYSAVFICFVTKPFMVWKKWLMPLCLAGH